MANGSAGMAQLERKGVVKPEDEKDGKDAKETAAIRSFTAFRESLGHAGPGNYRLVVINEGLGNKRDLRFYGPEAVASVGRLINGAKCYINHQTEAEMRDRPEGDLGELCGYWKDGLVEKGPDGRLRCVATLVTSDTHAGRDAAGHCDEALKYAEDFPASGDVHCGTSINGDGELEPRKMKFDDQELEVNYVTEVTSLPSADLVTQPARGGRVLALVESIRGAKSREEAHVMADNAFKSIIRKLAEAISGTKDEKLVAVAAEAEKAVKAAEEAEEEAKKKAEAEEACKGSEEEAKKEADTEESEEADEEEEPAAKDEKPAGGKKTSVIKHEEKHTYGGESMKAIRAAAKQLVEVEAVLKESGIKGVTAEDILSMRPAERKAFLALAEARKESFISAGETLRGTNGVVESGIATKLAESIGRK